VKSKQRLAILFGAIVALMTILAVVPVFGATATLRFPDASDTTAAVSWARQGGNVMIEVTDADLDTGTSKTINVTHDGASCDVGTTFQISPLGVSGGGVTVDANVTAPVLDQDASGVVSAADVTVTSTDIAILSVDGANGLITVRCAVANVSGITQLVYTSGAVNDTADGNTADLLGTVGVTSDASPASGIYILEESGSQTGVFRGVLSLVTTASATSTYECLKATCAVANGGTSVSLGARTTTLAAIAEGAFADGTWSVGDLQVSAADTVALTFVDTATAGTAVNRSASITVETTDPTVANTSPASGTATDNNLPTIGAEITDTDSLVASASINVVFGYDFTATPNSTIDDSDVIDVVANDIDAIDSGFAVEQRVATINAAEQNQDHVIYWWVLGNDVAGNNFVSDASATDSAGTANPCDADAFFASGFNVDDGLNSIDISVTANVHGCQGFSISVDRTAPSLVSAATGVFWDTTLSGADKTQTDVTKANVTSISVIFDGALDAGSVNRTDFTVDGVTPLGVTTFAGASTRVFLEVATQDPAARPVVAVVGTLKDLAGNDTDSGSATASDGIAPTLTLTVSSDATPSAARPVTNDKVSVALSSDEKGTGVQIFVVPVGADTTTSGTETELTELGGPTSWTATADQTGDGVYSIRARARDLNSTTNIGTAGLATSTAAITLANGIIFELDTTIPTPTILPSTAAGTDDPDTVISINFANEGKEYGLTTAGAVTTNPATVVTNFDTYGTVTVTKAELDGVDILASLSTSDNIRFLFKAASLAIGAHTLDVSATDSAGNAVVFTRHTFSVTVRAATSISLTPGWNMISFPGNPEDASIDAVIGTVPVTVVMAFDPTNAAQWLIASRADATESFSGTLTTISSALGYWVLTDTFESISTFIPRTAGGAAGGGTPVQPPTVKLVAGWNLVPVLDVTGGQTGTTNIDPATYFGSVATITRVYWFNTLDGSWVTVDHAGAGDHTAGDNDLTLRIGRSYWVFTTAAGTITP
jgi:hypothetical protein